jgi:hypothetical protein
MGNNIFFMRSISSFPVIYYGFPPPVSVVVLGLYRTPMN